MPPADASGGSAAHPVSKGIGIIGTAVPPQYGHISSCRPNTGIFRRAAAASRILARGRKISVIDSVYSAYTFCVESLSTRRYTMLKYYVNDSCIGCTLCASTCPAVFRMTDDNVAEAYTDPTTDVRRLTQTRLLTDVPLTQSKKEADIFECQKTGFGKYRNRFFSFTLLRRRRFRHLRRLLRLRAPPPREYICHTARSYLLSSPQALE